MSGADSMPELSDTKAAIRDELLRMEEDCTHSGKAHFNASSRWTFWHYVFGIPSVILATLAGAAFFKDYPIVAGIMTSVVAVLTALMTFLKPSERAAGHKSSGDQYLALRNDSRVYREIMLVRASEEDEAVTAMSGLTTRRNELNAASPAFANRDFQKARKGINSGESTHAVDRN